MGKIHLLSDKIINLIAAGEVVERPASAVKELLENSIDAGATIIKLKLDNFGLDLIEVEDNGVGIEEDDLEKAVTQHATSKILNENDLLNIKTLGFRGEALASIAEVSEEIEIISKTDNNKASILTRKGGKNIVQKHPLETRGTIVRIKKILEAVPARKKFLKSLPTEFKHITDIFTNIALINLPIHFELWNNGELINKLTSTDSLKDRIYEIWGSAIANNLFEIPKVEINNIKIQAYAGKPEIARKTSSIQFTYLNGRYIQDKTILSAVNEAFRGFIHKELKPVFFVSISVSPAEIDVNIHPRKLEVKFANPSEVFKAIYAVFRKTLEKSTKEIIMNSTSSIPFSTPAPAREPSFVNNNFRDTQSSPRLSTQPRTEKIQTAMDFTKEIARTEQISETPTDNTILNFEPFQLFNTYILFEKGNDLIMVDQHAAAEKINFEKLALNIGTVKTRPLLVPQIVELSVANKTLILDRAEVLNTAGFIINDFGGNAIQVSEVPEFASTDVDIDSVINSFLEDHEEFKSMYNLYKEIYPFLTEHNYLLLATTACHMSIRAGQKLTALEMRQLITDLSKLRNPYNCPHGRPVMWNLEKQEIEKNFKRKI